MTPDTLTNERVLPHNLEAERSILGAVLLHNECFADAAELVTAEEFYRAAHRTLFEHFTSLARENVTIDFVTLKNSLTKKGKLEEVGGGTYISALVDGMPRSSNIAHYARIVHEKAQLRAAIHTANKILGEAYEADDDARDVIDRAEQALFDLSQGVAVGGFKRLSEILPGVLDQIEAWCRTPGGVSGIASGFVDLDYMTRGFQPGNLVILAARPSMGKSAMVLNIAQYVATSGKTVGLFSLEMSEVDLAIRTLTSEAGIDGHRLQRGRVQEQEWTRLSQAIGSLSEIPLFIDESPTVSVFDIRTRARRLKLQHGLDLLIVDYTQLMIGQGKSENRTLELGAISRALKAVAKDLKVPLIALSQLSRKLEERSDKRPMLSDLRESGALEQDADVVLFIYRPEVYEEHPPPEHLGLAELIIAKQRNGPIGTVKLAWKESETRFGNYSEADAPEDRRLPMGDQ